MAVSNIAQVSPADNSLLKPALAKKKTALVLTGGGARAAYQVGVLEGICSLCERNVPLPFEIICGTSAGAINATALAVSADNFSLAMARLGRVWRNFHADQVYDSSMGAVFRTLMGWGSVMLFGWMIKQRPSSLLNNAPLRRLLTEQFDFSRIQKSIDDGHLHALSITASGYSSGQSLSFFQGHESRESWRRADRLGVRAELTVEHLLASSAIPIVFPAIKINREYFGDGSMRQLAPISPAIHLGADKVLVIGNGNGKPSTRSPDRTYPSPAQIAGHALSSIFLDSLSVDIERLERVNKTLNSIPEDVREKAGITLKPIELLTISPSQAIEEIATSYRHCLPRSLRMVLGGGGGMNRKGSQILSYLLFESEYTRALMQLGRSDALNQAESIRKFLDLK